jgi:creatinine amidohydrolase/Fe(II)-dependent formamide hydrolase-like protein
MDNVIQRGIIATLATCLMLVAVPPARSAAAGDSVYMEELTWPELRAAIQHGKTVAIVPTGGTEQSGPHLVLGKHNYVVRQTAGRIAQTLGNALVAPVLAYVPEGNIEPPTENMTLPGTLSLPPKVFEEVLEATARSLRAHGFKLICFIGDHGLSQRSQQAVADRLNAQWAKVGVQVLDVSDYYSDANGQVAWLISQGEDRRKIGTHAALRDTSELMAVDPDGVRVDRIAPGGDPKESGVYGDPTDSSAEKGAKLLQLKVDAAVRQISKHLPSSPAATVAQ